jgi:tetratricopeptide (TPR) repeat protein
MNDIELSNLIQRAEALMKTNWLHAVQLLEQASEKRPDDPRPLLSLGEFYHRRQQYEKAVSVLQSALNIDPRDNYVKYMVANSSFALGNYRMAIVYYDMIEDPGQDILYNKALTLAYMGRNHESIELLRALLKDVDNNPFFYFLLIEQLIRVQDYQTAAPTLQERKKGQASTATCCC